METFCGCEPDDPDRCDDPVTRWLCLNLTRGMFSPEVNAAVDALLAGEPHPLLDRLRRDLEVEPDAPS